MGLMKHIRIPVWGWLVLLLLLVTFTSPRLSIAEENAAEPAPVSGEAGAPAPGRADFPPGQAGWAARAITRRVSGFANFRARAAHATWRSAPASRWTVREARVCLRALRELGVRARRHDRKLPNPVPTPVEVVDRVGGVWFRSTHEERTLLISCELAARLPQMAAVLRRHGVRGVDVMSAYRDKPFSSFHTMGLGLDLLRFWTLRGVLSVSEHFVETPDVETCAAPEPKGWEARKLLSIACALHDTDAFSTVLTPNYNDGHRDHFHIDARPRDSRLFVR